MSLRKVKNNTVTVDGKKLTGEGLKNYEGDIVEINIDHRLNYEAYKGRKFICKLRNLKDEGRK